MDDGFLNERLMERLRRMRRVYVRDVGSRDASLGLASAANVLEPQVRTTHG